MRRVYIAAQSELEKLHNMHLLNLFLTDKTTRQNILWATDTYSELGEDYQRDKRIDAQLLFKQPFQLMFRAERAKEEQSKRTKSHAEVFTPFWIVKKMNDFADAEWFGCEGVFDSERIIFPKKKQWKRYVDSRRMEITCGEAPYLVTRYDVTSGEPIEISQRTGLLDRKLRVVSEKAETEAEWLKWAMRAVQATYGYEFQGDNVLLARINLFSTFNEYMVARWEHDLDQANAKKLANIIAWNIWQMDGLTGRIPYCPSKDCEQLIMEEWGWPAIPEEEQQLKCKVFDWRTNRSFEYNSLRK